MPDPPMIEDISKRLVSRAEGEIEKVESTSERISVIREKVDAALANNKEELASELANPATEHDYNRLLTLETTRVELEGLDRELDNVWLNLEERARSIRERWLALHMKIYGTEDVEE